MAGRLNINQFQILFEEARIEAYEYFDRSIRRLPRGRDGKIKTVGVGLDDNDVDAFRHSYVSGVFTQRYDEKTAEVLGLLNEYDPFGMLSNAPNPKSRNMDLWNNRVGRKYGRKTRGRKTLLKLIHQALKQGELIIDLNDSREFAGSRNPPKRMTKPIVSLLKSKSGRNAVYFDLLKRVVLSREELVAQIYAGDYPGYSVKIIGGIETPVSKRDGRAVNNIG